MNMTDYLPQWGCPYCPGVFPSRDHIKKHLEPDKQLITDLLRQFQQALLPNCQKNRETTSSSTASDRENGVDLDSTKRSPAEEPFRCPHSDCQAKQPYSKKPHLLRHYKMHVVCNVTCGCSQTFNRVDQFEKHVEKDCLIMKDNARGITGHEQKHLQILGLKKVMTSNAIQDLNQQLERSQKRGLSDKATGSPSSNETPGTTVRGLKRKRTGEMEGSLSATDTKRRCSGQDGSMMEDAISPQSHFNNGVQRGSLDGLDSIPSYIGSMGGIQTDQYVAGNKPGATQASGNSISHLYPDKSTNDISALNCVGINPPTPGSDHIDGTQPPRTGNTEEQWSYRAGFGWSDFNACDSTTSQDQWNDFTSMHNTEHYNYGAFNAEKEDRWRYLSNDWNPFNAAFDDFNNSLASNI